MNIRTSASQDGLITSVIVDLLRSDIEAIQSEQSFHGMLRRVQMAIEERVTMLIISETEAKLIEYLRQQITPEYVQTLVAEVLQQRIMSLVLPPGSER